MVLFDNELYMTATDEIRVYSDSATGGAAPTRTISGASTGLDGDFGIAIGLAQ